MCMLFKDVVYVMKFVEKYIFKKRNIYLINKDDIEELCHMEIRDDLTVNFYDLNSKDLKSVLLKVYENAELVLKYSKRDDKLWKLIIAYYNGNPAGAFWIFEPCEKIFYDSIEIEPNQILFCSVYVNSRYRGHGIQNQMREKALEYWKSNCINKEIVSVVECRNVPSNKNIQKCGIKIKGYNYLIKLMGKNIISIYRGNNKTKIWFLINVKKA